jgi:hypothetical protein
MTTDHTPFVAVLYSLLGDVTQSLALLVAVLIDMEVEEQIPRRRELKYISKQLGAVLFASGPVVFFQPTSV